MPGPLTPPPVQGRAISRKRLPFSFGPRFFLLVLLGFAWLVPAWWSPAFLFVLLTWDVLALALFCFDLLRLPAPSQLQVTREWSAPLTLGHPATVNLTLENFSAALLATAMIDAVPLTLSDEPPRLQLTVAPFSSGCVSYPVVPRERGQVTLGETYLRYRGSLGLAERWASAPLHQTISVLPDLLQAKEQTLYVMRTRHVGIDRRQQRYAGLGHEFQSLREYRDGDEMRDISWTATARHRHLVTRTYEAERSQTVWVVMDAGRLMRARIQESPSLESRSLESPSPLTWSKLDYAVNAALSLAQVAMLQGDKVGLAAYGRKIQRFIPASRGSHHLRRIVDALAHVSGETAEADHAQAMRTVLHAQTRRALVIWLTDFAETAGTPDMLEYAAALGRRHLVLFVALSQPDLAARAREIPQSAAAMFEQAAALEIVERRQALLRHLRETGVLALELTPAQTTSGLVNEYLRIKDRNLL